jgi:hypothetical protein
MQAGKVEMKDSPRPFGHCNIVDQVRDLLELAL